jgi:hypothetical protein
MLHIGRSLFCRVTFILLTLFLADYFKERKSCKSAIFGLRGIEPWAFFDQIYVIQGNWTGAARKEALENELQKVGLDSPRRLQAWPGMFDSNSGHRGAWYAHQSLLGNPRTGRDCVLVFEDDVKFTTQFVRNRRQILRNIIKFLSATSRWDIFYLGSNPVQMQRLESMENVVRLHSWALFAYIISDSGRALFAKRQFPRATGGTIDGISHDSKYAFGVYPSVAIHPSGTYSDTLGGRRSANLSMVWRCNEELLFEYASNPIKCHPRMSEISNFGDVNPKWYETRNKTYEPLMVCH